MESRELEKRLRLALPSTERNCWINKQECPYGKPDGQFQYRPTTFCMVGVCQNLKNMAEEFEQVLEVEKEIDERVDAIIDQKIDKEKVTLSSELRVLADDIDDTTKRLVLILAADLIEKDEEIRDRDIVLIDNL